MHSFITVVLVGELEGGGGGKYHVFCNGLRRDQDRGSLSAFLLWLLIDSLMEIEQ